MADVVVIGAGMGGLAAAARLAARGLSVTVVEALHEPGGKAGTVLLDGVRCDTGPSVVTLPDVIDALYADCSRPSPVRLRRLDPAFRYRWPDGVALDVHHAVDDTLASVRGTLGGDAAAELEAFLGYARAIWELSAPAFVYGPRPGLATFFRMGLPRLVELPRLDTLRSMRAAIHAQVAEPHLRDLLLRYATYNGSDPRVAPATLNCIASVELEGGCFGVEGGLGQLARHLEALGRELGVVFRYGERVLGLDLDRGRVRAVRTERENLATSRVVSNADVAHLARLVPGVPRPTLGPSTSGWTAVVQARREERPPHQVLFPTRYDQEFVDLFDGPRAPREPTAYLCAQDRAHGVGHWGESEPLFVMANAPSTADAEHDEALGERTLARLVAAGMVRDPVLRWQRHPRDLAATFPDTDGALYGVASNSRFAAFLRPDNRAGGVHGLYLASGSAHPGGGVPLCLLSGRQAAQQLLADRGTP